MSTKTRIPEGYREDAQGRLVHIDTIKEIDLLRDELVKKLHGQAQERNRILREFREESEVAIQEFLEASAARFKVKHRGQKGNVTLTSFDGRQKIVIQSQPKISFDERLQTAKDLIDKCIRKWSEGADPKILALVNDAFQVDAEGRVATGKILSLRRLDIEDKDWKRAMDAIGESIQVLSSKTYLRFYVRVDSTGEYEPVSLDLASV